MRSSSIGRAACVWAFIFAKLKAKVVDDISGIFDDVGALSQESGSSVAAEVLKFGKVVGVSSSREATEDTLAGKQV